MSTIETSALPRFESPQIKKLGWTVESDHYNAYNTMLQAEVHALQLLGASSAIKQTVDQVPTVNEAQGKLVAVRVAGYLLLEFCAHSNFFGITPSAALVKWFISPPVSSQSNQHDVVIDNGAGLRDNFLRLFRKSNVQYPLRSFHPSPPSFDTLKDMIKDSLDSAGDGFSTSRKKVLARDGYKCVVSGVYDESSLMNCAELRDIRGVAAVILETAHIFNESTMQGIEPLVRDSEDFRMYNKTYHAVGALAILESFGFSRFSDTFRKSGGVHEVWNLMSLQYDVCTLFNHLKLWFERTDKPHRYKLCTARKIHEQTMRWLARHDLKDVDTPVFVEFNSRYKEAPPPDPLLFALHATCARVAHMSGATEFFEQVEQDAEETRVLALDGSSGSLLVHLLSPFAVVPGVT